MRQRIQYKLASLAFRALSGLALDYLAGDCQLVADSGRRSLRSVELLLCATSEQHLRRSILRVRRSAGMERAAVQST